MAMLHPSLETSFFQTLGQAYQTSHTQVSLHATFGYTSMPAVLIPGSLLSP